MFAVLLMVSPQAHAQLAPAQPGVRTAPGSVLSRPPAGAARIDANPDQPSFRPSATLPAIDEPSVLLRRSQVPDETGLRLEPAIRDGDLSVPATPGGEVDGRFDTTDPTSRLIDPTAAEEADQRSQADVDAFAAPPAGGNPQLFQIEDIRPLDPRLNRLPRRLSEADPYEPIGIRLGTFVVFPEVEITGHRTSNVFSSPDGETDYGADLRPRLRLVSDWSVHAVELSATGDYGTLADNPDEADRSYAAEARGRLDVTRFTNVQSVARYGEARESRSAIDATTAGPRAVARTIETETALNHRFNRLRVALRGGVSDVAYTDTDSGRERDATETSGAVRLSWEFKPTLTAFTEVELIDRSFAAAAGDGFRRDSEGRRVRAGISLGETSDILRGEFALGWAGQDLAAAPLADADGVLIEANLAWRMSALTTMLLTASTDISETTQTGGGAVFERRAGASLRHAFRPHLIGTAGIALGQRDYAGLDVGERQLDLSLGLDYYVSREAVLFSSWQRTVFRSGFDGVDYEDDEFRLGLRLRR